MSGAALRAVLVDDEPLARAGLRAILARDPGVEVIGEAASGSEAVTVVESCRPDVVFLDVEMPELDGFAVLDAFRRACDPAVVFVTAYADHASRAFDVRATDYVLKPLRPSRVLEAVGRARENRRVHGARPRCLPVKVGDRIIVLDERAVDWVGADDEHVELHARAVCHRARGSLASLERRLDPRRFVRIHRSTIVNLERVRELQPYFHGDCFAVLDDGTRLRVSRTYRLDLEKALGR